jgi:hypothetical protein
VKLAVASSGIRLYINDKIGFTFEIGFYGRSLLENGKN